jgi:hypothetical protein
MAARLIVLSHQGLQFLGVANSSYLLGFLARVDAVATNARHAIDSANTAVSVAGSRCWSCPSSLPGIHCQGRAIGTSSCCQTTAADGPAQSPIVQQRELVNQGVVNHFAASTNSTPPSDHERSGPLMENEASPLSNQQLGR